MLRSSLPGVRRIHPGSNALLMMMRRPATASVRGVATNDGTPSAKSQVNGATPRISLDKILAAMDGPAAQAVVQPSTTASATTANVQAPVMQSADVAVSDVSVPPPAASDAVKEPQVQKSASAAANSGKSALQDSTMTMPKASRKAISVSPLHGSVAVRAMRDANALVASAAALDAAEEEVSRLLAGSVVGRRTDRQRRETARRKTASLLAEAVAKNADALSIQSALELPDVKKSLNDFVREADAGWAARKKPDTAAALFVHVDADMFMCAVELQRRPELAGGPFVVADRSRGGHAPAVVLSADYKARMYGVTPGTPLTVAQCACPTLTVCYADTAAYTAANEALLAAARSFDPCATSPAPGHVLLEATQLAASMSAADLRAGKRSAAANVCRKVWFHVMAATQLPSSAGIAQTPSVAALAATLKKPHGFASLAGDRSRLCEKLAAVDVSRLRRLTPQGVGLLNAFGVTTLDDVAAKLPLLARFKGSLVPDDLLRVVSLAAVGIIDDGPAVPASSPGRERRTQPVPKKRAGNAAQSKKVAQESKAALLTSAVAMADVEAVRRRRLSVKDTFAGDVATVSDRVLQQLLRSAPPKGKGNAATGTSKANVDAVVGLADPVLKSILRLSPAGTTVSVAKAKGTSATPTSKAKAAVAVDVAVITDPVIKSILQPTPAAGTTVSVAKGKSNAAAATSKANVDAVVGLADPVLKSILQSTPVPASVAKTSVRINMTKATRSTNANAKKKKKTTKEAKLQAPAGAPTKGRRSNAKRTAATAAKSSKRKASDGKATRARNQAVSVKDESTTITTHQQVTSAAPPAASSDVVVPELLVPEVIVRHELGSLAPATVNARRRLTVDMDSAARTACLQRALENALQELTNSPFATGSVTVDIKTMLPGEAGAVHHSATVDLSKATRDAAAIAQALQAAAMWLPELGSSDEQQAATPVEVSVNLSGLTRV
jgi:hypothetical protein